MKICHTFDLQNIHTHAHFLIKPFSVSIAADSTIATMFKPQMQLQSASLQLTFR